MNLRIEFLGLPGSGKTTLRQGLLSHFKKKDSANYLSSEEAYYLRMKSSGDKIYRYILSALPYESGLKLSKWIQGRSLFQLGAQNSFLAIHGKALNAFLNSVVYEKMSIQDKQNVMGNFLAMGSVWGMLDAPVFSDSKIFFEEGFVQKSFMFVDHDYCYADIKTQLHDYIFNIPLPEIIIHVKAGVSQSHQRMLGRKDGLTNRLKGSSEFKIDHFLNQADEHINYVISELSTQVNCRVIEVYNDGPIDKVIDSTLEKLSISFDI